MPKSFGRVEDRLAIQDLIHRYALYIDTREINEWTHLFASDAAFDERAFGAELFTGHDEIRAYGQHLAATVEHVIHHMTNIILDDVTDAIARGTVFGIVESRRDGGDHARYHVIYKDRYEKMDGRWLISERVLHKAFPTETVSSGA